MNHAEDQNSPPLPASAPPVLANLPPKPAASPSSWRNLVAILLSLFLGLFLASGLASVLDDSCVLLLGKNLFTAISGILTFLTVLAAILVYGLMGLSPVIPKRIVLPVIAFMALTLLATPLVAIFYYPWILQYDLLASGAVVVFGVAMICWLQGGWKLRWPLVAQKHLGTRAFSSLNLALFIFLNVFVLLPLVAAYLGGCASVAVNRFTDGFMALRPAGIVVQARKYTRDDGKTILLFPMSHIADSSFYKSVMQTVSSNSVVLLEGVTDNSNLLAHGISYKRAAKTLHLEEQHEDFKLQQGELVRADVDVSDFSSNTLALLNIVGLVHSEGVNAHTMSLLMGYSPTEDMEQQLLDDILLKRNAHVLAELRARLPNANDFIIPWGAAHMAGISKKIQKCGFRLVATHDFVAIHFGGKKSNATDPGWTQYSGKPD